MSQDGISDTPPEGEEDRAVWSIRRVARALTGQVISLEEAQKLFAEAKDRMTQAMAEGNVNRGDAGHD